MVNVKIGGMLIAIFLLFGGFLFIGMLMGVISLYGLKTNMFDERRLFKLINK